MTQSGTHPWPTTQAPLFAERFALTIAALLAFVARLGPHHRILAPILYPLLRRIARARTIFALYMRRAAAGNPQPPPRKPRPADTSPPRAPRRPTPHFPTRHGWLRHALRQHPQAHNIGAWRGQIEHLFADPTLAALIAATPSLDRALNPLRRLLGLGEPPPPRPRAPRKPRPARPAPPQASLPPFSPPNRLTPRNARLARKKPA